MNEDGSRRWIRPKPSAGVWNSRRRVVAYALMLLYLAIPHIQLRGKPLILLDAPRREFTLFGYTFLPTDTLLFMIFLGIVVLLVVSFTALFGRVWCGWGCPQTVWMEYLFRPLERWFEGGRAGSLGIDRGKGHLHPRRVLKYAVYAALAVILANTFLAYFVGVDQLKVWVTQSPVEQPTSFAIMAVTTILVFLDFAYFREQTCTIACPYGRWQSVLLDRASVIVAYDPGRGEPRQKGRDRTGAGDCIDCSACVQTCPTGIDIRDGLQMECIHCTQCIDACDAIMDQVGTTRGLIRYTSREALEGAPQHLLRARTILYPAGLIVLLGIFAWQLSIKSTADVTLLRALDQPFREDADGAISNQVRVRIANRSGEARNYRLAIIGADGGQVIIPVNPFPVAHNATETLSLFVILPKSAFTAGQHEIRLRVDDGAGFDEEFPYQLLGPTGATSRTPPAGPSSTHGAP